MINLKTSNPGQHIGGILWLQGTFKGYSMESITGLMKISIFELGINAEGKPSANNTTYTKDNNAFGMLHPSVRKTTSTGSRTLSGGEKSAVYKSVWDSIADVFLWMEYNKISDAIKKSKNPNDIIDFAESKSWMKSMANYKASSNDKAKDFVEKGRNAFLIRLVAFASITIVVIGMLLKKKPGKIPGIL
jgi:hypothetical protein